MRQIITDYLEFSNCLSLIAFSYNKLIFKALPRRTLDNSWEPYVGPIRAAPGGPLTGGELRTVRSLPTLLYSLRRNSDWIQT